MIASNCFRCIADLVEAQSLRWVARILTQVFQVSPTMAFIGVRDLMAHVGDEAVAGTVTAAVRHPARAPGRQCAPAPVLPAAW